MEAFTSLLGADADLLGRWLHLLGCEAHPRALAEVIRALPAPQFQTLAQAQAWAVLPVAGSARLGLDQWQAVLRTAFLAQVLAEQLGLSDPDALRWRVLLAVSGVNLPHDPQMQELTEFRGVRPELLLDASVPIKIFAVVDALEVLDEFQAAQLAETLLDLDAEHFSELAEWAGSRCSDLVETLKLNSDPDADWSDRLWIQQQVGMLSSLLAFGSNLDELQAGHEFAARSLFRRVPMLLISDGRRLRPRNGASELAIPLESPVSQIAAALREGEQRTLLDGPETSVGDRQLLRRLRAAEALCTPLVSAGRAVGALLFVPDEDVDHELALGVYAEQLAYHINALSAQDDAELELVKQYRAQEEKRLREIVHEVNNPLSVVYNYLHILELRLRHEPSATEQLEMIGDELQRAGEILQRVREMTPIVDVETTAEIVFTEFDVNELARRVYELHKGYAGDHGAELELELSPGALQISSDEPRIAQVLNNLMRNAIEASSGASVCLGSRVGVFREGREGLELYVRDTGPGLAREVLERLADPKQTSKGADHAGLGLHIVHRLVQELQGSIDVRTADAQGTTFTIYLPLTPA